MTSTERGLAAELLGTALAAVREAAQLARTMRAEAVGDVQTKSTRTDVVTAADRAVERLVVARLRAARPDDAVLGEEYGVTGAAGAVRWLLDPIDGTVNYLYGLAPYAVSLAAEVSGQVICGVVHEATTGTEWTATRGGGAYRDGHPVTGSAVTELGQALVATGFGYAAERRAHQASVLARLLPQVRDIRRFGSAAVDLCLTAEGRMDAYYEKGLNLWDYAAGALIAEEAGLRVGGLHGAPAGSDFLLAAPPALYPALHDRLAALDAAGGP